MTYTYWISSEERNVIRQLVGINAESASHARELFYARYPTRSIRSIRTDCRDQTGAMN